MWGSCRKTTVLEWLRCWAVFLVLGACLYFMLYFMFGFWRFGQYATHQRQQLLHETDHPTLLVACRDLMGRYEHLRGAGNSGDEVIVDPQDPTLPAAILKLRPTWISVARNRVTIELLGGFDHCGVHAFARGTPGHGNVELIEGLWYYSED